MTLETLNPSMLDKAVAAASVLIFSGSALAIGGGGGGTGPMAEYTSSGSFATTSGSEGQDCTVFRPRNVPEGTPLILWGEPDRLVRLTSAFLQYTCVSVQFQSRLHGPADPIHGPDDGGSQRAV